MSFSRVFWLLPLALMLFLGLPVQGEEQFKSQPGLQRFLDKEDARELWENYQKEILHHAAKARDVALSYWNKKFNAKFSVAPGQLTHILMETVYGRIYHVVMNLVKADCPEDKSVDPQNCKIQPGSPKLTCKLAVIIFFQHNKGYISEEGCKEVDAFPAPPNDHERDYPPPPPPPNEKEEEPYPFV